LFFLDDCVNDGGWPWSWRGEQRSGRSGHPPLFSSRARPHRAALHPPHLELVILGQTQQVAPLHGQQILQGRLAHADGHVCCCRTDRRDAAARRRASQVKRRRPRTRKARRRLLMRGECSLSCAHGLSCRRFGGRSSGPHARKKRANETNTGSLHLHSLSLSLTSSTQPPLPDLAGRIGTRGTAPRHSPQGLAHPRPICQARGPLGTCLTHRAREK
jgi:hypothetical protein